MASNRIKGITLEIGGDTTRLDKALRQVDTQLNTIQADLRDVDRGLKMDPGNVELLAQKQRLLAEAVNSSRQRMDELKRAAEVAQRELAEGKITEEQYRAINLELDLATANYNAAEQAAKDFNSTASKIDSVAGVVHSAGEKIGAGVKKVGQAAAEMAKIGAASIGAASAAIGTLVKESVQSYASYEQLIGGVETLFGDSSRTVVLNAKDAFRTAGLSANEYMETVTSFSASLIKGLRGNTEKAAELADLAITDMADNANKMGTDMSSIQSAYQGFAKQNYTMLDNLKLGYGGTQAEMVRLINDSRILNRKIEDLNNISFDQIVQAIHVVQKNMGITGTTALEASTTIEGSVASMKAAWENLTVGLANRDGDLYMYVDDFADSVVTVANNLLPVVEAVLNGIGYMIDGLVPVLTEKIPEMISTLLPSLLDAGVQLVSSIIQGILSALPALVPTLVGSFQTIINSLSDFMPLLADSGRELLSYLASGILEGIPALADAALDVANSLSEGIKENLPEILNAMRFFVSNLINTVIENAPKFLEAAATIVSTLLQGLLEYLPRLLKWLPHAIERLSGTLAENLPKILEIAWDLVSALALGLVEAIPALVAAIPDIVVAIVDGFAEVMDSFVELGANIIEGIIDGIVGAASNLWNSVGDVVTGMVDNVKNLLGIHSPSRVFAGIGENMALGLSEGWEDQYGAVKKRIESGMDFGTANMSLIAGVQTQQPSVYAKSDSGSVYENGASAGGNLGLTRITVNFTGSLAQIARMMQPEITVENARLGPQFVK